RNGSAVDETWTGYVAHTRHSRPCESVNTRIVTPRYMCKSGSGAQECDSGHTSATAGPALAGQLGCTATQLLGGCTDRSAARDHRWDGTMEEHEELDRPRRSTISAAGSRRAAMRVVQDGDSMMLVYEFDTGMLAEGPPTLVFE